MISIALRQVTKRFGETVALDRVDLRIEPGEIFFLLGPSGCGKTTLLRTIAGFHEPDAGEILFNDEDVSRVPAWRRETGMMFQSYALWPHLNVARNVAFGLEERRLPRPEVKRRVEEALAAVQMAGLGERRIDQLSGGQQQRVALARAMVIRPRALLLDEPLSNLDARLRLEMRGEIRRICREAGLTAIYVTHDQKEALSIADRLAVLRGGRIVQTGTPLETYRRPQSRFVADFMGETNFVEGKMTAPDLVETALGSFRVRENSALAHGSTITLSIRPEAWRLSPAASPLNSIPVRIVERTYLGDLAQYTLATTAGPALKAVELNPHALPVGGMFATVSPEDIVLLPPEA